MNTITLDHWYLHKNKMTIALLRFHVSISILKNAQSVYYQTNIK